MKRHLLIAFGFLALTACTSSTEKIHLVGSPIEFKLQKSTDPEVYATYNGGTVSTQQIMEQNPVQADLKNQENMIRLEFILQKFIEDSKASTSANLSIFLPEPTRSITDLSKSWGLALNPKSNITFVKVAPEKDVIAQWGDQQIKTADVDGSSVRLAIVRTRAYRENLNRLQGVLIRRTLLEAAQGEKVEIEEYIKKHISSDDSALSESDFEQFLMDSNIKKADVNPNQEKALRNIAVEKRRNILIEKYVAKNLLSGDVIVHEFPPTFKVQVPEGWETIWGVSEAPVPVLFFGDFVCGPCRDALKNILQVKDQYSGNLGIGFNFLFPKGDRDSRMISEAALCARAQGKKYFQKFAETYATNPPGADEASLEKVVQDSGADVEAYKKCFLTRAHKDLLNQHLDFAARVGATSQPTVIIDGEPLEGSISKEELREILDRNVAAHSTWLGSIWRRFKAIFSN